MPRRHDAPFEAAGAGRVALEVMGVDLHALDRAGGAEPNDRPVVAAAATAPRLPAVAHVRAAPGHDQVLAVAEEHVAARDDEAAVLHRREIDLVRAGADASQSGTTRRARAAARRRRRDRFAAAGASRAWRPIDREHVLRVALERASAAATSCQAASRHRPATACSATSHTSIAHAPDSCP